MKGTIRQRGPQKWEVRAYVGRDLNGKPIQKSRTVHGGKRKAEDELRKLQNEVRLGQHRTKRGTVAHLLDRYFAHLEDQGRSPNTLRGYRSKARSRIVPTLGGVDLDDLTPEKLDDFYRDLRADGLAPASVRQIHAILSGALKQAYKWGWVPENVANRATAPQATAGEIDPPSPEDVRRLVLIAEERNPTLAAMLWVAATTGARRGELCALRWSKVDLDRRTVVIDTSVVELSAAQVSLKGTKSRRGARIALDEVTVAVLARHRHRVELTAAAAGVTMAADPFVFSQSPSGAVPYSPNRVTEFVRRLRVWAGLPTLRMHDLRHFMATQAIAAGADVRTVAGRLRHDPAMTMNVYSAFLEERDRAIADHVGALLAPATTTAPTPVGVGPSAALPRVPREEEPGQPN